MNDVLKHWNSLSIQDAAAELIPICGSRAWASLLAASRPYASEAELARAAHQVWWSLPPDDWLEAFRCHPRIGERANVQEDQQKLQHAAPQSNRATAWSRQEQSSVESAPVDVLDILAAKNREYERRFGFTYIVCATGKSAEQMLTIMQHRLANGHTAELREAAEQQQQIAQLRLRKWLAQ